MARKFPNTSSEPSTTVTEFLPMAAAERVRRQMAPVLDARFVPALRNAEFERGTVFVCDGKGEEDRHVDLPRRKEDLSDPRPTRSTGILTRFTSLAFGRERCSTAMEPPFSALIVCRMLP